MRLIDADNVNFHCNYDGDCTGDIYSCKECENYICDFRDIQEQPTAYDIDKVVEELKNASWEETDISTVIYIDDAIEIVKKGIRKDISE